MSEETKPRIVKSHDINLDSDYVNGIHDVVKSTRMYL